MTRALWILPLLCACDKKAPPPTPAPEKPAGVRKEPLPPVQGPFTREELRTLNFPDTVVVAQWGEKHYQYYENSHAIRMIVQWFEGDGSVRYEARRDELQTTKVEDRYGFKSYLFTTSRPNEEYGVPSRHVEIGFVKGKTFAYVMAGNLEQDILESDLVTLVRRAVELWIPKL